MAKKKTLGHRVIELEDREPIMYQFIDELRASSKKLDRQHEETLKRIAENEANHNAHMRAYEELMRESRERISQNEEGLRESRELSHALTILQGEAFKMLKKLTSQTNGHEKRLKKAGM
jgi:hypothetical protein